MKKITTVLTKFALIFLLLLCSSTVLLASKRINGNGTITVKKKTTEQFHSIQLKTFCNVIVNNGSMPMVNLKVDENLQDIYSIEVVNGVLIVSTDQWPEPTQIQLTIQVPFITGFKNSGWGKVEINDLDTERFTLESETGYAQLNGNVKLLTITGGGGKIDASQMRADRTQIKQEGWGTIILGESKQLTIEGELGKVYYKGSPEIEKSNTKESLRVINTDVKPSNQTNTPTVSVKYVNVSIKNNSLFKFSFVIRGPKTSPFSYSFSLFPFNSKKEKVPVGTKFFSEGFGNKEKLLIEITESDAGKTIDLFK